MRLNPDCTRDILLALESMTVPYEIVSFTAQSLREQSPKLQCYSAVEIAYHISQCAASGFFLGYDEDMSGNCFLQDLSPKAHAFLANIRENTVWTKTKGIASKVGSTSLDVMCQIASEVITDLVRSQFGR